MRRVRTAILSSLVLAAVGCTSAPQATQDTASAGASPATRATATALPQQTPRSPWVAAGRMGESRVENSFTVLADGRVLAAGGFGDGLASDVRASAELYDPQTRSWTRTGDMVEKRAGQTATLLRDGTVLVAGGALSPTDRLDSAEIYDPTSGAWRATGSMREARAGHTATLLGDGRVLVAGGDADDGAMASAELYDPETGTWARTGKLNAARSGSVAVILPGGQVLVAGGASGSDALASTELYDPSAGAWTTVGPLAEPRVAHAAVALDRGRVLIVGGLRGGLDGNLQPADILASAELFDPTTRTWSATGSMASPRFQFSLTVLTDGRVLAAAGDRLGDGPYSSAEVYEAGSGTWTTTTHMIEGRAAQRAVLLGDGDVLLAGGEGPEARGLASAELFDGPPAPVAEILGDSGTMPAGRYRTAFEPGMIITITDVVDLDCVAGHVCQGDIDVNIANWVDLEFGNAHGSELLIFRIDQVLVDEATGQTTEPPADFAGWMAGRPGVSEVNPPAAVTVGGIPATRLDVHLGRNVTIGASGLEDLPGFGIAGGPEKRAWITMVKVAGHWVVIVEVLGPENVAGDFDAAVRDLQPVIDSISWE